MNNERESKSRAFSRLTIPQLRDLGQSSIKLLDIDPETGRSTVMEGLSEGEYAHAMGFSLEKREEQKRIENMLKIRRLKVTNL